MLKVAAMIFGLAILMIVHESGHYFIARAFKMRVERFSIGFGPTIWRHQSKGSDTVFQVALIPFLAYVQIAGMNPFEEIDPDDEGSYANASLIGRTSAIIAGPLANYFFASVLFFVALLLGGKAAEEPLITVDTTEKTAAVQAGLESGDRIVSIDGHKIQKWEEIPDYVVPNPGKRLDIVVEREGRIESFVVVPKDENGKGFLGVGRERVPMPASEAAKQSIIQPATIVALTAVSLVRMFTGDEDPQLTGPLGMMRETGKAAEAGLPVYLWFIGFLSTSVGFFNMLPLPALDGGRLMFLGYEATTRRRPNQKIEAQIHMAGMLLLLGTLLFVTFREAGTDKAPSELAAERAAERAAEEKAAKETAEKKAGAQESEDAPQKDAGSAKP